ncbi:hypothetical protein B0H19DRAFT_233413 [Mycena capillaripes]|nr:hypothetical protein B0H19DRAFT_233413 [Mycena capillaripes]
MADIELPLTFIIVGASVAGLAAAIALKHSRHRVIVLEKDSQLGGAEQGRNGCARLPPNGTKILRDWGLEAEMKAKSSGMPGWTFYKYDPGDSDGFLGINRWNQELLFEARGGYATFRHQSLLRILYEKLHPTDNIKAKGKEDNAPHATVLFGAEVVTIDCDAGSVTLKSGQVITADGIIGADGADGIVRRTLFLEEDIEPVNDVPMGLALYSATIPKGLVIEAGLADLFYNELASTIYMGNNRAAMTCHTGEEGDTTVWLYTPDSSQEGTWTDEAEKKISLVTGSCDPGLRKLISLAGSVTCVQLKTPRTLESWVSESGKVLALGEAAHPVPPGAFHGYSLALEDGAFIGKVFSHTRDPDRIPEFFNAFQEHREPRCTSIRDMDIQYVQVITMPDGEMQAGRDSDMLANHKVGHNAMDGDMQQMLEDFRVVFGYDAMDDADEWWMSWGRFRDTPGDQTAQPNGFANLFRMSFTNSVSQAFEEEEVESTEHQLALSQGMF